MAPGLAVHHVTTVPFLRNLPLPNLIETSGLSYSYLLNIATAQCDFLTLWQVWGELDLAFLQNI